HVPGGTGEAEVGPLGDAAGVGDLSVFAQYRLYKSTTTQTHIALLAGLTMPTGDTGATGALGEPFEGEFQPGSGAWSPSLGVAMTKRSGSWSFDANVLYQFTGDGRYFAHGVFEDGN